MMEIKISTASDKSSHRIQNETQNKLIYYQVLADDLTNRKLGSILSISQKHPSTKSSAVSTKKKLNCRFLADCIEMQETKNKIISKGNQITDF